MDFWFLTQLSVNCCFKIYKNMEMSKMKKFFSDFKAFISKGNILDMAVGVVVGSAFSKIVSSLVADVINPLVGWRPEVCNFQI